MKISKRVQFGLLLLLLILCTWNVITDIPSTNQKNYNISVIIRGKMDDSWSNLKKGAENAAEDLNVNLRFVASIDGNTAEEQNELLQQETNGTDAILIAPINRVLLKESINEISQTKPLILIESNIAGAHSIPVIQSDNEGMGSALAEAVIKHGVKRKQVLILSGNTMCGSVVERQKGFMKWMDGAQAKCQIVNAGSFEPEAIYVLMKERKPDVVVALDTGILENLVKANAIYKSSFPSRRVTIYGAGCSGVTLKALENKEIEALVASDSFSIGYLGVQEAVRRIEEGTANSNEMIRYVVTDSEQMYDDEHQALLFPFVK